MQSSTALELLAGEAAPPAPVAGGAMQSFTMLQLSPPAFDSLLSQSRHSRGCRKAPRAVVE